MIARHQHYYTRSEIDRIMPAVYDEAVAETGPAREDDDGPRAKRDPSRQPDWPAEVMDVRSGLRLAGLLHDEQIVLESLYADRHSLERIAKRMKVTPEAAQAVWQGALDKIIDALGGKRPNLEEF